MLARCWTCGIELWIMWVFNNRTYCKDHYEQHMQDESYVNNYLLLEAIREL